MSSKTKKGSKKIIQSSVQPDISVIVADENKTVVSTETTIVEKKKRGRKKQNVVLEIEDSVEVDIVVEEPVKPPHKKRGRKPKGGKIIQQTIVADEKTNTETNVILHLKCSLKDINDNDDIVSNYPNTYKYNPSVENIQSFHFDNIKSNNFLIDDMDGHNDNIENIENIENNDNNNMIDSKPLLNSMNINSTMNDNEKPYNSYINNISCNGSIYHDKNSNHIKNDIWEKLNALKVNLHNNNIYDKRSACFWCTYEFDNPPIFIPKNEFKDSYQVYGCFCSPECSVAHLMNEKIDSSIKFERYQLLNHIYGKIYKYTKNIKPAPDPHYVLEKFYGNLSIKEYRDLFKTDQLLIVVDKPLTHVFPELYEDNSDFILNQRTIPSNSTFKLKRKNTNGKKTSVMDTMTTNHL
jgi:hypothetical protein